MSPDTFVTYLPGRSNSRSAYTIDHPSERAVDCGPYKRVGHFDIDAASAFDNTCRYKT